jgi:hypothetical protein
MTARGNEGPRRGRLEGGREVRAVARRRQHALVAVAIFVVLCAGAAAALAFTAAPAHAWEAWQHDTATGCVVPCHHNGGLTVTDATCIACHAGRVSVPGYTCWSCHVPGQGTSSLSSPSSACSQDCHLYSPSDKGYTVAFTHGALPHDGAAGYGKTCLDCHQTSVPIVDPGGNPHHSGQTTPSPTCEDCHNGVDAVAQATHDGNPCTSCHTGMNVPPVPATCNKCHPASTFGTPDCLQCHAGQVHNTKPQPPACSDCHGDGYQQHAGKVACLTCHTGITAFHHGLSQTTTQKNCRSCHAKKHAGRNVPQSKCATCHKGTGTGPAAKAQHSTSVTKAKTCSACHSKALHATRRGSRITSCRTCHKGEFHARQQSPSNSVCTACHRRAVRHSNGYGCLLCHRSAVHNARPT